MSSTAFHTIPHVSKDSHCDSEHSQGTKMCVQCGEHAKSNSAINCWSCLDKYPKNEKTVKTFDGRGRICKSCSKCGEPAKSNRAKKCVHGCTEPFPKKALGTKKKRKKCGIVNKCGIVPKEVKKMKRTSSLTLFSETPEENDFNFFDEFSMSDEFSDDFSMSDEFSMSYEFSDDFSIPRQMSNDIDELSPFVTNETLYEEFVRGYFE